MGPTLNPYYATADYSYRDGRKVPLGFKQRTRLLRQQELAVSVLLPLVVPAILRGGGVVVVPKVPVILRAGSVVVVVVLNVPVILRGGSVVVPKVPVILRGGSVMVVVLNVPVVWW